MPSFTKVIIVGNLTRDPELTVTANELSICKLGIAVNEVTGSGEDRKEYVSYYDATAFGKRADTISRYLKKGNPILIDGRLKQDRWENANGDKRNKVQIVVDGFTFLGSKNDQDDNQNRSSEPEQKAYQWSKGGIDGITSSKYSPKQNEPPNEPEEAESIPF